MMACLQGEVSARESQGGEGCIRTARFPHRESEDSFRVHQACMTLEMDIA